MSPVALRATAYHEAGHAVAAIVRQVRKHVSIEPDTGRGAAGHVRFVGRRSKTPTALHARAVVALAGEAAQHQFSPRSVRQHHGSGDRETVLEAARQATSSVEQANLLVKFWTVCARDLIASRWTAVNQAATALLQPKKQTCAEVLDMAAVSAATCQTLCYQLSE